jgi:hypothetical protein
VAQQREFGARRVILLERTNLLEQLRSALVVQRRSVLKTRLCGQDATSSGLPRGRAEPLDPRPRARPSAQASRRVRSSTAPPTAWRSRFRRCASVVPSTPLAPRSWHGFCTVDAWAIRQQKGNDDEIRRVVACDRGRCWSHDAERVQYHRRGRSRRGARGGRDRR